MPAKEILEAKIAEQDLLAHNLRKLEAELADAEKARQEATAAVSIAESTSQKTAAEQQKYHANFALRKAREAAARDVGPLQERLEAIARELPHLQHQAEGDEQREAREAFAEAARKVASWFDTGLALAAELDKVEQDALRRWPAAVTVAGMPKCRRERACRAGR
jgi:hypothetical protein